MKVLVCFLFVGLAAALPWEENENETTCPCGWVNRGRIVGGKETRQNEYPLIAAVEENNSQICGGSIITQWHVLTAAHCTHGSSAVRMSVRVGAHDLATRVAANAGTRHRVARIIDHEQYDHDATINDISLLLLATPIRFTQDVGPVCLPSQPPNLTGQRLKAIGWGLTNDRTQGGRPSQRLLEVDLPLYPMATCTRQWRLTNPSSQICTDTANGIDTCQGDSGGPLIYVDPVTNRLTQAALVSFGSKCAGGAPAVNTNIHYFMNWIERNVRASRPGAEVCKRK